MSRPLLSKPNSTPRPRYHDEDIYDDYEDDGDISSSPHSSASPSSHHSIHLPPSSPLSRTQSACSRSLQFARRKLHWFRHLEWKKQCAAITITILIIFIIVWQTFSTCSIVPSFLRQSASSAPTPVSSFDPNEIPLAWMDQRERELIEDTLKEMRNPTKQKRAVDALASSSATALIPQLEDAEIVYQRRYPSLRMLEYGSGYSTFHFSRFADEYYSIEHDLNFCSGLYDMASHAGVPPSEIEVYRIERDLTDAVIATRWDETRPEPIKPRIRIYCVAPSQDEKRAEEESRWAAFCCCFKRCPSTTSMYEDYLRTPSWLDALHSDGRVDSSTSQRILSSSRTSSASDLTSLLPSGVGLSARHLFPFPRFASTFAQPKPRRFDFVLVDGRARPQAAWLVWSLLSKRARVAIHDWNRRPAYHEVLQMFDIVDSQYESNQPGGGGLVILKPKEASEGVIKDVPSWWLKEMK